MTSYFFEIYPVHQNFSHGDNDEMVIVCQCCHTFTQSTYVWSFMGKSLIYEVYLAEDTFNCHLRLDGSLFGG